MDTLQVLKSNAIAAYKRGTPSEKILLATLFGEKNLFTDITDRVKTFEDACEVLGINDEKSSGDVNIHIHDISKDAKSIEAYCKLIIIARALNEGWTPDWNDTNQYKWFPWFKMKAGFGFSHSGCVRWPANTNVGSRLCFKTEALAEYAGKQFESIYNDFLSL